MAQQNLNSVTTAGSITPSSDYLLISKGGTAINKITAATALSNAFAGAAKNTAISASDSLMMATGGTTANRIDYNVLAKAIIENYASSSLAGSNQSVKTAINVLNSNLQYNAGDTIVRNFNAVGRVVNAQNAIYFTLNLFRPINANSFSITFDHINVYSTDGITSFAFAEPYTITVKQIINNSIAVALQTDSTYPVGRTALLEISGCRITFS